jgi:hypothetical protein
MSVHNAIAVQSDAPQRLDLAPHRPLLPETRSLLRLLAAAGWVQMVSWLTPKSESSEVLFLKSNLPKKPPQDLRYCEQEAAHRC